MTPEQRKEALELAKRRILHQSDTHRGYIDLFYLANALIAAESELSTQRERITELTAWEAKNEGLMEMQSKAIESLSAKLANLREALESRNKRARQCVEYLGVPITNPSGEPFDELSQALQVMPTWPELTALREEAKQLATAINEDGVR